MKATATPAFIRPPATLPTTGINFNKFPAAALPNPEIKVDFKAPVTTPWDILYPLALYNPTIIVVWIGINKAESENGIGLAETAAAPVVAVCIIVSSAVVNFTYFLL